MCVCSCQALPMPTIVTSSVTPPATSPIAPPGRRDSTTQCGRLNRRDSRASPERPRLQRLQRQSTAFDEPCLPLGMCQSRVHVTQHFVRAQILLVCSLNRQSARIATLVEPRRRLRRRAACSPGQPQPGQCIARQAGQQGASLARSQPRARRQSTQKVKSSTIVND